MEKQKFTMPSLAYEMQELAPVISMNDFFLMCFHRKFICMQNS